MVPVAAAKKFPGSLHHQPEHVLNENMLYLEDFFVFSNNIENQLAEMWFLFGVEAHLSQDLISAQHSGVSLS